MPGRTSALAAAICLALMLAGSTDQATAQSDHVRVDPDTPAGKEYALPLDAARRDAAGAAGAGSDGGSPPLFGAGISRKRGYEAEGAGGSGGEPAAGGQAPNGTGAATADEAATPGAAAAQTAGSGSSAGLLTVLIGLGVLAFGGLVALLFRWLREDPST